MHRQEMIVISENNIIFSINFCSKLFSAQNFALTNEALQLRLILIKLLPI